MSLGRVAVGRPAVTLTEVPQPRVESVPIEATTPVSRATRRHRVAVTLLLADSVMLVAAALLAALVSRGSTPLVSTIHSWTGAPPLAFTLACLVVTLTLLARRHLYTLESLGWESGEFSRVGISVAKGVVVTVLGTLVLGLPVPSREWIVVSIVLGITLVAGSRGLLRIVGSRMLRQQESWLRRPTLVVGSNVEAAEVARLLRASPDSGLVPVGCLRSSHKDTLSFDYCAPVLPSFGTARDLRRIVTEQQIDTVIIVASAFDYDVIQRMIKELHDLSVAVHISSALTEVLSTRVLMREVGGIPLISLRGASLSPAKQRCKRAFDVAVAGAIVLVGLPLWALIALLIKLTSRGPVFYVQQRVGRGGVPFGMFKFRSMVSGAENMLASVHGQTNADGSPCYKPVSDYGCKVLNDPRVTPVGRWLRKYSLDEFPQLINVLKGEMSLVGPRPPLPCETERYTQADWRRLEVAPGMAGLWQISGRAELTFRDMVRLDVFYIDNWSLSFDVSLLMRVIPAVVLARGAC